jgi:hypothetical protein
MPNQDALKTLIVGTSRPAANEKREAAAPASDPGRPRSAGRRCGPPADFPVGAQRRRPPLGRETDREGAPDEAPLAPSCAP